MSVESLTSLRLKLAAQDIDNRSSVPCALPPATVLQIDARDWGKAAETAKSEHWRWAGVWADDRGFDLTVNACLEHRGTYLILRTTLAPERASLPSHAPYYWAADRPERHIQDLFGVRFEDHPDPRRWIRHRAWDEGVHPLRKEFPAAGSNAEETPPDRDYPFLKAQGASVYEIPVGPVHAGIIEPGHFRFQAVGETVLHLEERLGYVHKGIEKIAEGRDPDGLARLAGRVSGDTTVGHAWAACMAMERAAGIEIPLRAAYLRGILAERERVINHLWDLGALCNDVGFAFGYYQFGRLREQWLRENQVHFGHRLLMDRIVPGGARVDITPATAKAMHRSITALRVELDELLTLLDANSSLEDRFLNAGILSTELAAALGALGFVGRASGQTFDTRRDAPYPPYDRLKVSVPTESQGDVSSRFWVRYKELRAGLRLLGDLLEGMPEGERVARWQVPAEGAEGFAAIEGWRGEILCFVRFGSDNAIRRYWPRDPSVINWPALEKLILGNIVPDFPVCNKSVNGSYSGHDL
ncbi:hydrogenase large subunit [Methylococcus geothermalis]|uniref:Ni,Fe-hydrogenase III large subunit n=1 Tax=Methylococcus geothermalis TaxID=2681310 RepID=A0A858Q9T0_9GAMM|nr:NADH-quinone oxidoreductase subunit C [Methylococcus geothermalis]QJD30627.1 Ni,Fe-hydrogenase III large subunit [Methylococcus geothermalis]